jgi:hypothetical protein
VASTPVTIPLLLGLEFMWDKKGRVGIDLSLLIVTDSTLGKEPPERKEGHSERSSGSEVEDVPMNDNIVAA